MPNFGGFFGKKKNAKFFCKIHSSKKDYSQLLELNYMFFK